MYVTKCFDSHPHCTLTEHFDPDWLGQAVAGHVGGDADVEALVGGAKVADAEVTRRSDHHPKENK